MGGETEPTQDEGLVLQAVLRLARGMRQASQDGELTGSAIILLGSLQRAGPMSAVELARREGLQPQSLSRLLARLDKQGLIARSADPQDARRHVIAITPAGSEMLMQQIMKRREWLGERMAQRLTGAERATLLDAAALMLRLAT